MIKVIRQMPELTEKLARVFTDVSCAAFKLTPYLVTMKTDGGLLILTTLTCALLYAEGIDSVQELSKKAKTDNELKKQLLLYRVLIPESCDERKFCEQLRAILLNEKKRQLHGRKNGFIIFTTTACNARCYYCFEHGYAHVTMTEETAQKTAEYIEAHADGEVTLTWFGGEPLVNTEAINIITEYLISHNVSFKSHIVSNAYLFTPELIIRAKEKWHLVNAQITLDGTQENYNRIKNYANGDRDAFTHVLGNIKALAETGIHVSIHLTLSRENESDLYALLRAIKPMVTEHREQFSVLPSLLHQYSGTAVEDEMQQKLVSMKQWIRENALLAEPELPQNLLLNSCTADNPGMTVIQADGGLNRCDHIGESAPYGSIFYEETNKEIYEWWTERKAPIPECNGCAIYPQCLRLEHCAAKKFGCTAITRNARIFDLEAAIENAYRHDNNC